MQKIWRVKAIFFFLPIRLVVLLAIGQANLVFVLHLNQMYIDLLAVSYELLSLSNHGTLDLIEAVVVLVGFILICFEAIDLLPKPLQ